jgi:hypothetical protein
MDPRRRHLATRLMPPNLIRCRAVRLVALAFYILASTSFAFAHRSDPIPVDVTQFVLPDGTLPPICGGNGNSDSDSHHAHLPPCDFCCLIHAPGLPPPSGGELATRTSIEIESVAPPPAPRGAVETGAKSMCGK